MNLYLIGIDYAKTRFETREAVYKERKNIGEFFERTHGQKTVIFSTCNRFEIYLTAPDGYRGYEIVGLLMNKFPGFFDNAYFKSGEQEVFSHILRLASGLESQLRGETQITRQLQYWISQEDFPTDFRKLCQKALVLAAEIRSESGLNNFKINPAVLIVQDLLKLNLEPVKIEVIIAGTGKIAELFSAINDQRLSFTFVAHKNRKKAQFLAKKAGGSYISFAELPRALIVAKVLISATSSPHFIIKKEAFLSEISERNKPLYVYDLALPRDIDPAIGKIKNVFLKDFESLGPLFEEHNQKLKNQLDLAEYLAYENSSKSWQPQEPFSFRAG